MDWIMQSQAPFFRHHSRTNTNSHQAQQPNEPAGKQPVGKQPVGKQPVGKQPVGKQPVGKQHISEQHLSEQHLGEQSEQQEHEPGSFVEWDRQEIRPPTPQRIASIFAKMWQFDVKTALPPNLVYTPTLADMSLQQNIRLLFVDSKAQDTISCIVYATLNVLIAKSDDLMTDAQKRVAEKPLTKDQQRQTVDFYPCLMGLIRVLLIHCQNLSVVCDNSVHKCVLDMWQQTMGELHDLHSIIITASKKGLVELGDYPTEWMHSIQTLNADIDHIHTIILSLNDDLNQQLILINERDKQLRIIIAHYADAESRVQLIKAERNNLLVTLESYTLVPVITAENMRRIVMTGH